jgi:hypothetical protein
MTERSFRFILGISLLILLYFHLDIGIYVYIGILMFEGLTNWRIPVIASRLRYGAAYNPQELLSTDCATISFDAERVLRLLVAGFLVLTFVVFKEQAWFFPWFIGFMLFMAGMTNICPMVMGLRWLGFR